MNDEILLIPRDQLRETIKIIRKGLKGERDSETKEDLENWCDKMEKEIDAEENENLF